MFATTCRSSRVRTGAAVMIVAFFGGAALPAATVGLLWLTVVVGWGLLALSSIAIYRTVPHPDTGIPPESTGDNAD